MRIFAFFLSVLGLAACTTKDVPEASEPTAPQVECGSVLRPEVAKVLGDAYELFQQEPVQDAESIAKLDQLLGQRETLCPFEIATALEMRASFRSYSGRYDETDVIADLEDALAQNAWPEQKQLQLRVSIAQIYFTLDKYEEVARRLELYKSQAERAGGELTDQEHYLLGLSYFHLERYEEARQPMERAVALSRAETAPNKTYYFLLNYIYYKLGIRDERIALLEEAITIWPEDPSFAEQLAMLRDVDTFSEVIPELPFPSDADEQDIGEDRDAQPLIRIPPQWPQECADAPKQVQIVIEFDVSKRGEVINPRVIEATDDCLVPSTLRAVGKWKYRPKIVLGVPQQRYGVRTTFSFNLQ